MMSVISGHDLDCIKFPLVICDRNLHSFHVQNTTIIDRLDNHKITYDEDTCTAHDIVACFKS